MAIPKFPAGIRVNFKRIQDVSDPTAATDAATKQYVDQAFVGINDLKEPVRGTTTANVAITALINGLVHDGVTYATGDRILVRVNTIGSENGIYTIGASGTGVRATDADASAEVTRGFATTVMEGTTKGTGGTQANPITYIITNTGAITLGTTALTFAPIGAGAGTTYTADGNGIELVGSQFILELDGASLTKSATGLKVTTPAVTNFAANCVATTNPQTFAHGLGTADINVDVYESGSQVFPDVTVDATNVTVDWGGAPTVGQYRVVAGK